MKTSIHEFMSIMVQLKVYHWSTLSYARHKASDQCFTDLSALIDQYVETLLGKISRSKLFKNMSPLQINMQQATSDQFMVQRLQKLIGDLEGKRLPADLANIRDEMVIVLRTCLYLFSLS